MKHFFYSILLVIFYVPGICGTNAGTAGTPLFMLNTIATLPVSGSPFCDTTTISVSYAVTGTFNPDNVFTAQLSDANGNFSSPSILGSISGTTTGSMSVLIPAGTLPGEYYRIRVVSSSPPVTGVPCSNDLAIYIMGNTTIGSNSPVCQNDTIELSSGGGTAYQWSGPNGFSSTLQNPMILNAQLSNSGLYTVTVSNSPYCSQTQNTTVTVISGQINISMHPYGKAVIAGQNASFMVYASGNPDYQWQLSTNGGSTWSNLNNTSVYGGVNTNTLSVTGASLSMNNYRYRCVLSGCGTVISQEALLLVFLYPVHLWADTVHSCAGSQITVKIKAGNMANIGAASLTLWYQTDISWVDISPNGYYWKHPNIETLFVNGNVPTGLPNWKKLIMTTYNPTPFSIPNNDAIVELKFNFLSDSTILKWETWTLGACEITSPGGISLPVAYGNGFVIGGAVPATPGAIVGPSAVCRNMGPVNFQVPAVPLASTYTWTLPQGATLVSGAGTNSVNVIFTDTAQSGVISVCGQNNCGTGPTASKSIVVAPQLLVTASSNDTSFCTGSSLQLSASPSGGTAPYTFAWSGPGFSSGLQNPSLTVLTSNQGLYSVISTDVNGCKDTATLYIYVSQLPNVTANPASQSLCSGTPCSINLSGSVPGTTFSWTASVISGTASGYGSGTGISISQTLMNNENQPAVVRYVVIPNIMSCSGPSINVDITVNPLQPVVANISASPSGPVCQGDTVTFIAFVSNGGSNPVFQWQKNNITVGTNNSFWSSSDLMNGDLVKCIVTSGETCVSGNPDTSNVISMMVLAGPAISLGNDTTIPPGDSLLLQPGNGYASYLWSTGATTPAIIVSTTGIYSVTVTSAAGCTEADTIQVTVGYSLLSGTLQYHNNSSTPMSMSTVYLKSGGTVIQQTVTNALGQFSFSNVNPGSYTLDGATTREWGGVNSVDAMLVLKHFVGITHLTGLFVKAADVDGSNFINSLDALIIAKRFVLQIFSFPIGDWVFEQPAVNMTGLAPVVQNFKAVCAGDVNGSYIP